MTASNDLIRAAIRLAADASQAKTHGKPPGYYQRTYVKRSIIEDLRSALDRLGYGDDWRTLHQVVRVEERQPAEASS